MAVVNGLDERLQLGSAVHFSGAHMLGDLSGVPLNASNNGVGVGVGLATIIEVLNDDSLLTGVSTVEDDYDLAWLQADKREATN